MSQDSKHTRRWFQIPAVSHMPWFWLWLIISVATILALTTWVLVDASFHYALDIALIDVRIRPNPGMDLSRDHAWHELGSRLFLLGVLGFVGVLSTASAGICLAFGNASGRTIRAALAATTLVALWLWLIASYSRLNWLGTELRVRRQLPELRSLAIHLAEKWPTQDVEIAGYGVFQVDPQYPQILMFRESRSPYPMAETFGVFVRRRDNGAILLDLLYHADASVEFHWNGTAPASFRDDFDGFSIERKIRGIESLGNDAYLVTYESSLADSAADESPLGAAAP